MVKYCKKLAEGFRICLSKDMSVGENVEEMDESKLLNHIRRCQAELESLSSELLSMAVTSVVPKQAFLHRSEIVTSIVDLTKLTTDRYNPEVISWKYKSYEEFFSEIGRKIDNNMNTACRKEFLMEDIEKSKEKLGVK